MAMIQPGFRRKGTREEEEEERERKRESARASERARERARTDAPERERKEKEREREREKDTARTPQCDAFTTSTRAAYATRKCAGTLPRAMPPSDAKGATGSIMRTTFTGFLQIYASIISKIKRARPAPSSSEVKSSHRRHDGRLVELSAAAAGHVQRPAPKET
jgi:hypothetical protein